MADWGSSGASSASSSAYPMMEFIGVRSSWLIFARNRLLALLASTASSREAIERSSASSAFLRSVMSVMMPTSASVPSSRVTGVFWV